MLLLYHGLLVICSAKLVSSWQRFPISKKSERRVQSLLSGMSLSAKLAQMIQIDVDILFTETKIDKYIKLLKVGSVLNQPEGITSFSKWEDEILFNLYDASHSNPILYGLDSIHGASYVYNSSITPSPINIASSFDRNLAYEMGLLSSEESPPPWIFSPVLGLALEPKWPRVYETYGEDPLLVGEMSSNVINGLQQNRKKNLNTAACAKHFIGYSYPRTGHDRDPSWIPKRHLYQYFLPPWRKAIEESNVQSIMTSYNEFNGVPNTINHYAVEEVLRNKLQFDGVIITDYREIYSITEFHHATKNLLEALEIFLRETSVDMLMAVEDVMVVVNALSSIIGKDTFNNVTLMNRVDKSVERILRMKASLGLFDEDRVKTKRVPLYRNESRLMKMTSDSITLVKNEILPISAKTKILLTGPTSDSLAIQSGGWTGEWQGAENSTFFTYGSTLKEASQKTFDHVHYSCGVNITGTSCVGSNDTGIPKVVKILEANEIDYVIIALGENHYAEKQGDIRSLELPKEQYDLVIETKEAIKETNTKIILVYIGGRPRLLKKIHELVDAIFIAFLPGPYAGEAIMNIITGKYNPNARLPITYPMFEDG